ncbi:hypothetical protein P7C70_g7256, partial [Phenoliferia sp. Uapishka_3]
MAYEYEYGRDYNNDGYLEPWEVEGRGYGVDPLLGVDGGLGYGGVGLGGEGYYPGEYGGGYGGAYGAGAGCESFLRGWSSVIFAGRDATDVGILRADIEPGLGYDGYDSYGPDMLYNEMDFLEADEQYALGDLMYYQRQLEQDRALSEQERLARWEERLRWEEMEDSERRLRYAQMDARSLDRLGLQGGWYGRRFGGRQVDLSYLREVPLQRGLFAAPYRATFSRHRGLLGRFSPFYSRNHIHGYGRGVGVGGYGVPPRIGMGGGMGYPRGGAVGYGSRPLGAGMSLKAQELRTRLRIAETRAALTGLDAQQRALAIDDARRIREEINAEVRERRILDREARRENAVLSAEQQVAQRREMQRDLEAERAVQQIERIAYGPGAGLSSSAGLGRGRGWYGP